MFSILDWLGIPQGAEGNFGNYWGDSLRSLFAEVDVPLSTSNHLPAAGECLHVHPQRQKGESEMKRYSVPRVAHCCNGSEGPSRA